MLNKQEYSSFLVRVPFLYIKYKDNIMSSKVDLYFKKKIDIGLDLLSNNHKLKKEKPIKSENTKQRIREDKFINVKKTLLNKIENFEISHVFRQPYTNIDKSIQVLFFHLLYEDYMNDTWNNYVTGIEKIEQENINDKSKCTVSINYEINTSNNHLYDDETLLDVSNN